MLALLTVGDRVKIIKDVGLASISFFGALMAILIGTGLVYKEIEKRTIFTLLSKPIRRAEFLLGKFVGLVLTLLVMTGADEPDLPGPRLRPHPGRGPKLLAAVFFIFLELVLLTAVAILFSCFSTPILSSLFSLGFYLIGHFSWSLETLIKKMRPGPGRTARAGPLSPAARPGELQLQDRGRPRPAHPGRGLADRRRPTRSVYTAFVLAVAVLVFRRRDFV